MEKYKTKQRQLIMDFLKGNKERHLTADDIITNLCGASKTTVYRNLDKLVEEGTIRKYVVDDTTSACYQYVEESSKECCEHYHFKCNQCGMLFHVECEMMNDIKKHVLEEHAFVIDSSKTVFYGLCSKCRNQVK